MPDETILKLAGEIYGFDPAEARFISASTNTVYAFPKSGKWYILRLARKPAEALGQAKAEMDWLDYLANRGVSVSLPLKTRGGEIAAAVRANGTDYIITAFNVATGRFWDKNNPELWNTDIFRRWGGVTGELHRLTKAYTPDVAAEKRPAFTGNEALSEKISECPAAAKAAENLKSEMMSLPADADSYGLIHCDLHPWNFLIDGDKINVFDFDDCLYGWFALDIGVALYHALWWGRRNDAGKNFTNEIIEGFLEGYVSENRLDKIWIQRIPLFMRFRQLCKFSWFYDPSKSDAHQEERLRNIEDGVLFSDCQIELSMFGI